jgi:hypothetical protein
MKRAAPVTTLFLDVGEVLLTNGWDHLARRRAAKHFKRMRLAKHTVDSVRPLVETG